MMANTNAEIPLRPVAQAVKELAVATDDLEEQTLHLLGDIAPVLRPGPAAETPTSKAPPSPISPLAEAIRAVTARIQLLGRALSMARDAVEL